MAERHVVLDRKASEGDQDQELKAATERAEQAEAELARLKAGRTHTASAHSKDAAQETAGSGKTSGQHSAAESTKHTETTERQHTAAAAEHSADGPSEAHAAHDVELHGMEALRQDSMMSYLLDSLADGQDIGHYGRLTFAMVGRHFLSEDEMLAELTKDPDFSEEQAATMLRQVIDRDYSPPRRERIMEWQREQEFSIMPDPNDPDCGNVYRTLRFPTKTYKHIEHYQEEKA